MVLNAHKVVSMAERRLVLLKRERKVKRERKFAEVIWARQNWDH